MPETEALDYLPIYQVLHKKGIDFVIIGGQACNIWSLVYQSVESGLNDFLPFTSRDLDICANSQRDVIVLAKALRERPILNEPDSPSPGLGFVYYHSGGLEYPVSFMSGAFGIDDPKKIFNSRQTLSLGESKTPIHVMHPFLTMKGKLALVANPPRQSENDLKHLRMSPLYLKAFVKSLAKDGLDRDALKVCKLIVGLADTVDAVKVFHQFGVRPEASIPALLDIPEECPKLRRYLGNTLQDEITRIKGRRIRLKPARRR